MSPMKFENRQPREGINTTREHPLKRFAIVLGSAAVLVTLLVVSLQLAGGWIARKVPFRYEQLALEQTDIQLGSDNASEALTAWLNQLAEKVAHGLDMPEEIEITVHYDRDNVFNAFATIGGQLVFYRGLLSQMPNENALAMVMAHEIAHVLHRDPLAGLGGGLSSMLALTALTGQSGTGAAASILNQTGLLTGVQFTRSMENAADRAALAAVNTVYGHINGADTLFRLTGAERDDSAIPTWLERFASTHPLDDDRVRAIRQMADERGYASSGALTPLPAQFKQWLDDE